MSSLLRYGMMRSLNAINEKGCISSRSAPLAIFSQVEKNFLSQRSLRFLLTNPYYDFHCNMKKDRTKIIANPPLRNYHVSSFNPFSKAERNIVAVGKISDFGIMMGRRLMIMKGGGVSLVVAVLVVSLFMSSSSSNADSNPVAAFVEKTISSHSIVIFSKSYCPYCKRAKAVFKELNQAPHVIELDQRDDGSEIQDALSKIVGRRTVPQVFIKGKHIGGSDDTIVAYESGELDELLGIEKDDL